MKQQKTESRLRSKTLRISRFHFVLCAMLVLQILLFDAFKLIELDSVLKRWVATLALLIVSVVVWYSAKSRSTDVTYRRLLWLLAVTDITVISYFVYLQRGMASRAVILYVIPLLVLTILAKKSAIIAGSLLAVAGYIAAVISYFVINFNEGYKIELYGEAGFYGGVIVLIGGILWSIIGQQSKD